MDTSRYSILHNSLSLGLFSCLVYTFNKNLMKYLLCVLHSSIFIFFSKDSGWNPLKPSDFITPIMCHDPEFKNNELDHRPLSSFCFSLHYRAQNRQPLKQLHSTGKGVTNSAAWVNNIIDWKGECKKNNPNVMINVTWPLASLSGRQ